MRLPRLQAKGALFGQLIIARVKAVACFGYIQPAQFLDRLKFLAACPNTLLQAEDFWLDSSFTRWWRQHQLARAWPVTINGWFRGKFPLGLVPLANGRQDRNRGQ